MNWLAHFVLSPDDDRVRLGNWLPDVLSRPELAAVADLRVRLGIELHRRIDETTDRHPAVLAARDRMPAGLRRFAGIVLDVAWDHFLTRDFDQLAGEPLDGFVARVEAGLHAHSGQLPAAVQTVLARMQSERWLRSYGTPEGVELTLTRISRRLSARARAEFRPADARRLLEHESRQLAMHFAELWADLNPLVDHHALPVTSLIFPRRTEPLTSAATNAGVLERAASHLEPSGRYPSRATSRARAGGIATQPAPPGAAKEQ